MARLTREKRPKRDIKKSICLPSKEKRKNATLNKCLSHLPYKLSLELGATPIHIPLSNKSIRW